LLVPQGLRATVNQLAGWDGVAELTASGPQYGLRLTAVPRRTLTPSENPFEIFQFPAPGAEDADGLRLDIIPSDSFVSRFGGGETELLASVKETALHSVLLHHLPVAPAKVPFVAIENPSQ